MMRAIDQKTYPIKLPALLRWLFLLGLFQLVLISAGNAQSVPVTNDLLFHIDAQELIGLTNGQQFDTWNDLSGNGHHATSVGAGPVYRTNALNGHPVARFSGDSPGPYLEALLQDALTTEYTVFVVTQTTDGALAGGSAFASSGSSSDAYSFQVGTDNRSTGSGLPWRLTLNYGSGNYKLFIHAREDSVPMVLTSRADGSETKVWAANSGTQYVINTPQGYIDRFRIGAGRDGNIGFKGDIAEIMLYNRSLSNSERASMENYLLSKWGMNTISTGSDGTEISVDHTIRRAGLDTAKVQVQLRDSFGNAIKLKDQQVRFSTTFGLLDGGSSTESKSTDSNGIASINLSSSTQGLAEVTAEVLVNGSYDPVTNGGDAGTVSVNFVDASPLPVQNGMALWLDANESVSLDLSNDSVQTWMDKSGLGNHATQATTARQPVYVTNGINGKPSVRFAGGTTADGDGFHSYLVTPKGAVSPISDAMTVLMVVNQKTHSSKQGILATFDPANPAAGNPSSPRITIHLPWSNPRIYWDFGNTSGGRLSSNWNTSWTEKPSTWSFLADKSRNGGSGYMEYRRDGGLLNSKNSSITFNDIDSGSAFNIGRHEGLSDTPAFWGDIAEIIIYNRGLTPTELADVEEYLRKKWGFHDFYSLADGNVSSVNSWTHYPNFIGDASDFSKDEAPFAPDATDSLHIGNARRITLASNFESNGKIEVEDSGVLLAGTDTISGAADFHLHDGGTLGVGSEAGISSSGTAGNIQVSGTRTFSEQANYTYNGTSAQATGNGLPETVNDLTVDNANGVTAQKDHIVEGQLTLDNGLFTMPAGSSLVVGNGNIVVTNGAVRMQHTVDGNKGWRMVSSPVATSYENLFEGFVTQNFPGSNFPDLAPNLLWFDETDGGTTLQGWRQPGTLSAQVSAGRGHFHYVFDGAGRPDGSSNYTDTLPLTMSATGIENAFTGGDFNFDVTFTSRDASAGQTTDSTWIDINEADEGWNLVGNPTMATLDWNVSTGWTKVNIDSTIYVWDPAANEGNGEYLVWNGVTGTLSNGRIAPFQAFWVHANDNNPQLALNDRVKTTGGEYVGGSAAKTNSSGKEQAVVLPFKLEANGWESQSYITLMEQGNAGPDPRDAYRLQPMTESWLNLFTMSEENLPLVINNLPLEFEQNLELPLQVGGMVRGSPYAGEFTLRWDIPKNWPEDIQIALVDRKAGTAVSLLEASDYSFNYKTPATAAKVAKKEVPIIPVLPESVVFGKDTGKAKKKTSEQTRFLLRLSRGAAPADVPEKIALYQNYPNPFNPVTTIRFSLPEKTNVRLEVFDILGRRVATLIDNELATGIHEVQWNAGKYSSGIYLYRITTDTERRIKKMTLIK